MNSLDELTTLLPRIQEELRHKPGATALDKRAKERAVDTAEMLVTAQIDEWKADLAMQHAEAKHRRETISGSELGADTRSQIVKHFGDDCGKAQDTPVAQAHQVLRACPPIQMHLALLFVGLGLVGAGLGDFFSVWLLLRQRFVDDLNNQTGSVLMVASVSVMTLALYWLSGWEWERGRQKTAAAFYAGAIAVLVWALWDWAKPYNTALWRDFSPATGNVFSGDGGTSATGWFQLLVDIPLALAFSGCGLLFIRLKQQFGHTLKQWRGQQEALTLVEQDKAASASEASAERLGHMVQRLETNRARVVQHLVRRALDAETTAVETRRAALLRESRSIHKSQAAREQLVTEANRLTSWLASIHGADADGTETPSHSPRTNPPAQDAKLNRNSRVAVSVLAFALAFHVISPRVALAQSSAEICATAPVFQLLLDVSGSSPLTNQQYLAAVVPLMEERIRALPMCSTVMIVGVGDARIVPSMKSLKVLARSVPGKGTTRDEIASSLAHLLYSMPERIGKNPQGSSELIAAFADAARNTNPQAKEPNQIIMLSDGIENSRIADCETGHCRFPAPTFSLTGISVAIYGVGLGLDSAGAMALTKNWDGFFAKAGVKADLRRTF